MKAPLKIARIPFNEIISGEPRFLQEYTFSNDIDILMFKPILSQYSFFCIYRDYANVEEEDYDDAGTDLIGDDDEDGTDFDLDLKRVKDHLRGVFNEDDTAEDN